MLGLTISTDGCKFPPEGSSSHHYEIARAEYRKKRNERDGVTEVYDHTKLYSMLFCSQCGATKEIEVG